LIGIRNDKPYFYYCREDPNVENIHLISIESQIRLKDPEIHKANLLEHLDEEEKKNSSN